VDERLARYRKVCGFFYLRKRKGRAGRNVVKLSAEMQIHGDEFSHSTSKGFITSREPFALSSLRSRRIEGGAQ
jgi:hypothetical protein